MKNHLPNPTPAELERSISLQEIIVDEMRQCGGMISFAQYMELCLYTPELGYYASDNPIFGATGDFVTSANFSNHFAQTFVHHLEAIEEDLSKYTFIEIGAGSGELAYQILSSLIEKGLESIDYCIVEISASLRQRQKQKLQPLLKQANININWCAAIDRHYTHAFLLANEVIDALPVRLISLDQQGIKERCVKFNADKQLEFCQADFDQDTQNIIGQRLPETILNNSTDTYITEINTELVNFIKQIATFVEQGVLFFIDYGYPRTEYYHPQRAMGTLLCHYKHLAHDNPLLWPGLQDISINVDFTALAEAGVQADLELNSYGTQASFILASNYLQSLQGCVDNGAELEINTQIKNLIMPSAMGERFQIMAFTKNIELDIGQFVARDLSHRL